ncbi:DNA polymerase I [Pseudomonas syringae pv. actinidiae]|uniref:DNA polymerase I n=1 Tax=Pseudomonas syringae pv. actinidiae TaxID=103796 RepID=A0AAN4Q010_PSESF|nr:DNA polymerase I [Pseudomonas syringae]EPN56598.1 DNA polymerase I [Pseudomonas syringae pv. actinidiae ICMP 19079]EPN86010.1 DNA polymerase I [Pseudomonas syringae pv. actinidiae ICMP 19101]AKT28285.1 DNA polymerase I [Pseudomonas syringae pv. actinidiae ICMP 18884]AOE54836.1 DNA polymerase I [Pseudomonas syringae pv. actinidiae ICMP 18708]APP95699.1 DNA polymerase I [Pseudomonas syringae pv. actinidiae]
MTQAPLVLVDGSSYLYRAFHALPPLTTSKGLPTGAVKGVLNMLKSLRRQYPESPLAVVFDAKGGTFRDALYTDYKANRPSMPDDLRVQVDLLHACVKGMGYPFLCVEGVEADDVIGTLARSSAAADRPVVISTGDKDMAQLVDGHITLVNTMTGSVLDVAGVKEKFGVGPEHIIDYLALMGDKVDNIPGVPGVGEKTAVGLLVGVGGGIKELYDNLEMVATLPIRGAKTLAAKLEEHRAMAFLSYELATIKIDVPLDIELDQLHCSEPDRDKLMELYAELEFKSWIEDLQRDAKRAGQELVVEEPTVAAKEAAYEVILKQEQFDAWLKKLQAAPLFAFVTQSNGTDAQRAQLAGLSFAIQTHEAAYIPLTHSYMGVPQQLDRDTVLKTLKPLLEDPNKIKVGQHAKFAINLLANCAIGGDQAQGIELQGVRFDTILESYVLDSTATRHDRDSLVAKYLTHTPINFQDIAGKGAKQLTFDQIAIEQAGNYAAEEADLTLRLHEVFEARLAAIPSLQPVLNDIEMPLVPVLARIERQGALVDANLLGIQSVELGDKMTALEREAFAIAGEEFNLGSPKQLGVILYEKLGMPILSKTATGQPSTAEAVLAELAEQDFPLPKVLMQYRSMSKLKSTYTDRLPEQINPRTGRIHTSYHQAVAVTGRLSSSDPNLQNIPIRTAEGRRIRQAFVAPKGYKLLAADYSQIELRIMAHLAKDEGLLHAFRNDLDVHRATASEVFGVELENVTTDMRRSAKAINFGLIYGMSAFGLAKQIGVDRKQSQAYVDRYFARYPGVLDYMERTRTQAAEQGFVETIFGRRLYLPDINAKNPSLRNGAQRMAINAPMQGTAADIIKKAMVAVNGWLDESGLDARVILQVHDELVLEVREDLVDQISEQIRPHMSGAAELAVPLLVEVGVGNNWDEAH